VFINTSDSNQLWQKPCKKADTDSRANFGKEIIAGDTGGQNEFYIIIRKLMKDVLRILRLCLGSAQACSGRLTLSSGRLTFSLG